MWHHFENISSRYERRKAQYGSRALKIHSITVDRHVFYKASQSSLTACPGARYCEGELKFSADLVPRVPMMSPGHRGMSVMTGA